MFLLVAGYALAAVAFYAYIYLTARPDPYDESTVLDRAPGTGSPAAIAGTHSECAPQRGELVSSHVPAAR